VQPITPPSPDQQQPRKRSACRPEKPPGAIFFLFLLLIFAILCAPSPFQAAEFAFAPQRPVRVGIFSFAPFNFIDKDGLPQGLNPSLLREMTRDEDCQVTFVPGSWAEGLERLQRQEIDLMLSVARTPEREKTMDFTQESVAELWGQVFVRPEGNPKNISDLHGARVAVMRGDISGDNFIKTAEQLSIRCEIVELASHDAVFAAVRDGEADAGVAPQHFGLRHADTYNLVGSTILFSPFSIYFASKKGTQRELLNHIDAQLSRWKRDKDSFYYQSVNEWLANQDAPWALPPWLRYTLLAATLSILVFAGFSLYLKKTVDRKTKELRESKATLLAILNASKEAIFLADPSGTILAANQAMSARLPAPDEEFVGRKITDLLPPEIARAKEKGINQAVTTSEPVVLQDQQDDRTFESRFYPVRDQGDRIGQVAIFSLDITDRKLAESYREMGREVLQILNEPLTAARAIQRVLDRLKTRTGFDAVGIRLQAGEAFPYAAQQGFPPHVVVQEETLLACSANGGLRRDQDGTVRMHCPCGLVLADPVDQGPACTPGGSFWTNDAARLLDISPGDGSGLHPANQCIHLGQTSFALVPIRNKEGIIGLIHFNDRRKGCFTPESVDILEGIASHIGAALMRLQAEEALQIERKQLSDIIGFLPDATLALNLQGRVIIWNKAMEKMTGISAAEMIGKGNYAYAVPLYGVPRPQLINLILEENETINALYPEVIHDGDTLITEVFCPSLYRKGAWVYAKASPLRDSSGAVIGAIESIRDITESKQVEEEKKSLQTQLIQAQKMEAIGTLAGGIAHDFNNILGAILGYAEMARDASPAGSMATKDLDKVLEAGLRAATLVKQILSFSRQADTERIPLQPGHIAKEAIKLLRPVLPSTIAIRQRIETNLTPILADPTQVHQILMNLCTNAFHAMEQTGGTLEITLKDCELTAEELRQQPNVAPGRFAVLSIGDTGQGIAPEIRDKIFDPYFTTKEVGKGTGMGLAIIHGIITSYGGFVTCASEPGKGTVFRVFFPALAEEIVPADTHLAAELPGTERILLVDDEELLAGLGKTMLERLGYAVTVRTGSQEALRTFADQPDRFDAVITDQTMPNMTGVELARRMLHIRPDLPIILCTGYSTLINEAQIKAEGISGFAMKPLTKKELSTLLRQVLDGRKSPR
jgi:PAS domain S-box-containing protein